MPNPDEIVPVVHAEDTMTRPNGWLIAAMACQARYVLIPAG